MAHVYNQTVGTMVIKGESDTITTTSVKSSQIYTTILKERVRRFSVEVKRAELNCVI